MLLLLLVTAAWLSDRQGRSGRAGLFLAAATAIKIFPAFLFLYFIGRRKWSVVGSSLAWLAAIGLATVLILGPHTCTSFVADAMPKVADYRSVLINNSLPGLWSKLFDHGPKGFQFDPVCDNPTLARIGSFLSCLVIAGLTLRKAVQAQSAIESDQALGLAMVGMILVSPVAWDHYFLLLLLPLALMWTRLPAWSVRQWVFWGCVTLLWLKPFVFWRFFGVHREMVPGEAMHLTRWQIPIATSVSLIGLLVVFILACTEPPSRRQSPAVDLEFIREHGQATPMNPQRLAA